MRELKFRAWDKKRNEWYGASNPHSLTFEGFAIFGECTMICTPRCEDLKHLEITQYTGLEDKNGRKIYEGDIISDGYKFGEVRFGEYEHTFGASDGEDDYNDTREQYGWHFTDKWFGTRELGPYVRGEVVGNIFENPELLEKDS